MNILSLFLICFYQAVIGPFHEIQPSFLVITEFSRILSFKRHRRPPAIHSDDARFDINSPRNGKVLPNLQIEMHLDSQFCEYLSNISTQLVTE